MLKQRVITASVLLVILIAILNLKPLWPFAVMSLVFTVAAVWEWGRLNYLSSTASVILAILVAALCGLGVLSLQSASSTPVWLLHMPTLWLLGVSVWVVGGLVLLSKGSTRWQTWPRFLRVAIGIFLLLLVWVALIAARQHGLNFLLSLFSIVWVADIAAYFGGRAWGRRKLAPAISPGKSWEGVWTGLIAVLLVAMTWVWIESKISQPQFPSLYTLLKDNLGWLGMAVSVLFLTAMSVVGDLCESLVKRQAGVKDSSQLLPGHGGVLDRIDALLPVLPIAMYLISRFEN